MTPGENLLRTFADRFFRDALRKPDNDRLEPTLGDPPIPIENFAIDADWRVAFDIALWWQIEAADTADKAIKESQFRNIETRLS